MKLRSLAATAVALLAVGAQMPSHALGANKLPNASFEQSALEPAPVPPYTQPQPILPTGWVFEGVAGLFDHSPNDWKTGHRSATISIPASGKSKFCADPPVGCPSPNPADPLNIAKAQAALVYSVQPCWRNQANITVNGSTSYTLSMWTRLTLATINEGVFTRVRWLDANGVPISIGLGPSHRITNVNDVDTGWLFKSSTLTSPPSAKFAVVMFCATDDDWISNLRFDDVYFGAT